MTVKEVMELLSTLDPDAEVYIGYVDREYAENWFSSATNVFPPGSFAGQSIMGQDVTDKVVICEELADDQDWTFE